MRAGEGHKTLDPTVGRVGSKQNVLVNKSMLSSCLRSKIKIKKA